jgi:capsule polysaccharide export protein KpsE/RkpR
VAVKSEFDTVNGIYNQAETAFKGKKFSQAVDLYTQSESRFAGVRRTAAEKRRLAEEAIKTAEEKVVQSDETARDAERILEGGAR